MLYTVIWSAVALFAVLPIQLSACKGNQQTDIKQAARKIKHNGIDKYMAVGQLLKGKRGKGGKRGGKATEKYTTCSKKAKKVVKRNTRKSEDSSGTLDRKLNKKKVLTGASMAIEAAENIGFRNSCNSDTLVDDIFHPLPLIPYLDSREDTQKIRSIWKIAMQKTNIDSIEDLAQQKFNSFATSNFVFPQRALLQVYGRDIRKTSVTKAMGPSAELFKEEDLIGDNVSVSSSSSKIFATLYSG